MSERITSYVPDFIYKRMAGVEGLSGDSVFAGKVKAFRMSAYQELWKIIEEIAEYDYDAKVIVNWIKNKRNIKTNIAGTAFSVGVFAAACYLQKAGFRIPTRLPLHETGEDGYAWVRHESNISHFGNYIIEPVALYYSNMCEREKGGLDVVGVEAQKQGYWTNSDAMLHELGHVVHANLRELGEFNKVYTQKIRQAGSQVSGYAAQIGIRKSYKWKYMEFFTETFGGILTGKTYPKEVLMCMPQMKDWAKYDYDDADDYIDPYRELLTKAKNKDNRLGAYIPDYIYKRMPMGATDSVNKKFCTYYNLDYYDYSEEQRGMQIFQWYDFVKECKKKFYTDDMAQVVCELFCKIMNRSFDFINYATISEMELEMLKI